MQIKKIISNQYISNYINNVYSIDNANFPFLSYIGINFNNNAIINIKFYFSFFKRLNTFELKKVLPINDLSEFNSYYELWKESDIYNSLHQGATFAIKLTPNGKPTHYFHLRLNSLNTKSSFNFSDNEPKNKGICKEYTLDKISTKKYFYYTNKSTIQELSERFDIINSKFNVNVISEIECVESEEKQKIDLITNNSSYIDEFITQNASIELQNYFKQICENSNFIMFSPGIDNSRKVFSIYFIDKASSNSFIPFDGVRKFIDTNN